MTACPSISATHAPLPNDESSQGDSLAVGLLSGATLIALQKVLGLLRHIVFLTWLTQDQMGRFSVAQNVAITFGPLVLLGIPATLCRYIEYFRRMGQLRSYLTRVLSTCGVLVLAVVAAGLIAANRLALLIYGDPDTAPLVRVLVGVLGLYVTANLMNEMLLAQRRFRLASGLQFAATATFLGSSAIMMALTPLRDFAVLFAFGLSNLVILSASIGCLWREFISIRDHASPLPLREFWAKLSAYSLWNSTSSSLAGMYFFVINRTILYSPGLSATDAEALIGQLASGIFIPMQLMQFIGGFAGTTLFPYMTRDWEAGRKREVSEQFHTAIKLVTLFFCIGGVGVLISSPVLFDWILRGRYNNGLEILTLALVLYAWMNVIYFVPNFLLCVEKPHLVTGSQVPGVLLTCILGYLLIPGYGLRGAAIALMAGHALSLLNLLYYCEKYGLPVDRRLLVMVASPLVLAFGTVPATISVLLLTSVFLGTSWLLRTEEKQYCMGKMQRLVDRFHDYRQKNSLVSGR